MGPGLTLGENKRGEGEEGREEKRERGRARGVRGPTPGPLNLPFHPPFLLAPAQLSIPAPRRPLLQKRPKWLLLNYKS